MKCKISRKKVFINAFVLCLLLSFNFVYASEFQYKTFDSKNDVDVNKTWCITFNKKVDTNTLNNIKVFEKENNFNVKLQYKNISDNVVKIIPINEYDYGKDYYIVIEDGMKSLDGRNIGQAVKMDFQTKIPSNNVSNYNEFYALIKYSLSNFKSKIEINVKDYDSNYYKLDVINKILEKCPNIDYGYNGASGNIISYSDGSTKMIIDVKYKYSKDKMAEMKKLSQEKAQDIVSNLIEGKNMNDYEKERVLHDYLVNNAKYDERVFTKDMPYESYTDYGVLVKGIGVCSSYARAMYRLLNLAGIECIYVTGYADDGYKKVAHAWNIVKIDGEYYHLDATFDDPIVYTGEEIITHNYFNINDKKMAQDHIWDESKYPKCTK